MTEKEFDNYNFSINTTILVRGDFLFDKVLEVDFENRTINGVKISDIYEIKN